jgi:hypothetical protein
MFDIRQYAEKIYTQRVDMTYFITAPKDCILDIKEIYLTNPAGKRLYNIKYLQRRELGTMKLGDDKRGISIVNGESFISIWIPKQVENTEWKLKLIYQVKLPNVEHSLWKWSTIAAYLLFISLAILPFIPHVHDLIPMVPFFSRESILAVTGIAGATIAGLIALINNPIVVRMKVYLLFVIVVLAIIALDSDNYSKIAH